MPTPPRRLTHNGETLTLKEWAARTGIGVETIRSRLDHQGWTAERALGVPADQRFAGTGGVSAGGPRPCPRVKRHKSSGRAYVAWEERGKQHFRYFGKWGTKDAHAGYRRFAMEWASGATAPVKKGERVHVAELIEGYMKHVEAFYVKNGRPTSEVSVQRTACSVLAALYATTPADEFGPACFRACQQAMVEKGWVRKSVNRAVWRIIRCFRWGGGQELVHPDVHARLKAVDHLKAGRTTAPERPKTKPAPAADVEAIIAHLYDEPGRRTEPTGDVVPPPVSKTKAGTSRVNTPGASEPIVRPIEPRESRAFGDPGRSRRCARLETFPDTGSRSSPGGRTRPTSRPSSIRDRCGERPRSSGLNIRLRTEV